ncbi:hypothetical protein PACTADRAFT_140452 [Pachysolen tannophilus NRRL Y-2460]|uniref:Genetic interactor of prohibitin 5, mitochondrial n=1 Tax=Pachysolen tannophilus NRRL Y-2460 TaxID=669874 RepID=A0A1E4U0X6_PACTA|nr:hypothetical protein PACTADRAFT_140452 [Pachysolen tannophilus NRRL Y-2460]
MKSVAINLSHLQPVTALYRQLTKHINNLPFDVRTINLLQNYKKKTFRSRKNTNEIYHYKLIHYYLNLTSSISEKVNNFQAIEELLDFAYLQGVQLNKRAPNWFKSFLALKKDDYDLIISHGIWPHEHAIYSFIKNKNYNKEVDDNEAIKFLSKYDNYLSNQKNVKNGDIRITDLIPVTIGTPDDIKLNISYGVGDNSKSIDDQKKLQDKIIQMKRLIENLQKFVSTTEKKMSSKKDMVTLKDFKVEYLPNSLGLPLSKKRSKNLILRKIKYFKTALLQDFNPLSFEDFNYLEKMVEDNDNKNFNDKKNKITIMKYKKIVKNYLFKNFCFENLHEDNTQIKISKLPKIRAINYTL